MKRGALLLAILCLVAGQAEAAGIKKGYAMCRDEGSLRRLLAASKANDGGAFRKLMKGACRTIRGDERIKVITRTTVVVRVMVKGRRSGWWTVIEALN